MKPISPAPTHLTNPSKPNPSRQVTKPCPIKPQSHKATVPHPHPPRQHSRPPLILPREKTMALLLSHILPNDVPPCVVQVVTYLSKYVQ